MDTSAVTQPGANRYTQAAGAIHTIFVLALLAGWGFYGKRLADDLNSAANPNRAHFYLLTILFEWLLFVVVVAGVRRSGAPMRMVLGDRWHSVREVLRDIGIAAGFWIAAIAILAALGWLLRIDTLGRKMGFLYPHGAAEITLWIALSVTAGICEETVFRGYLQRQFIAWTKNVPAGIVLSAAIFGVAHAYQGFRTMMLIGAYGALFGILAHWRGSVRPGMIAHAWHDALGGVIAGLARH